jgi:tetratricopeptide (TPR) repeat protein
MTTRPARATAVVSLTSLMILGGLTAMRQTDAEWMSSGNWIRVGDDPKDAGDVSGEAASEFQDIERMRDPEARAVALLKLGKSEAEAGRRVSARVILRRAAQNWIALDEPGRPRSRMSVCEIAVEQSNAGDIAEARSTLRQATRIAIDTEQVVQQLYLLRDIASAYMALDDRKEARSTVELAIELAPASAEQGRPVDLTIPLLFVTLRMTVGDYDLAFALLEKAPLDEKHREVFKQSALLEMAQRVRPEDASAAPALERCVRIATTIEQTMLRSRTLSELASAQARLGDFSGAIRTARSINGESGTGTKWGAVYNKVLTLMAIAEAQAEAGETKAAGQNAEEAADVAQSIPDGSWRQGAIAQVVKTQARIGDISGASRSVELLIPGTRSRELSIIAAVQEELKDAPGSRATYRRAIADARFSLDPNSPTRPSSAGAAKVESYVDCKALETVARFQAMMGEYDKALETIRSMGVFEIKKRAIGELSQIQTRRGDRDGVEKWCRRLEDPALKEWVTFGIKEGLSRPEETYLIRKKKSAAPRR